MYCKKKDAANREQRDRVRNENENDSENDKSKHTKHHRDVGHEDKGGRDRKAKIWIRKKGITDREAEVQVRTMESDPAEV